MGRGRRESGWSWWLWTKARQGQCCSLFLMTPIHRASFHLCLVILVVSSFFADVRNSEDPNWGCFFPESIRSRLCWVPRSAALWAHAASLAYPLSYAKCLLQLSTLPGKAFQASGGVHISHLWIPLLCCLMLGFKYTVN